MKKAIAGCIILSSSVFLLAGCIQMALHANPELIPRFTEAFFEECDPLMARQSLPANLKFMEGLLKNDPQNQQLLTALCMGYAGYSLLFVEDRNPARASEIYLRARAYGFRALYGRTICAPYPDPK